MRRSEHKVCDICGEEIRVIGDTELLDGNICEDCASLLSPWFTDDLDCTELEAIQAQLDAREQNQADIENFHPTRKFGFDTRIIVDDEAGTFVAAETNDLWDENADIIRIEDVSYCTVTPEEDRAEIGPKRYRYRYQFLVEIGLDHPYLDEISFYLNEEPLEYESSEKGFLGFGGFDPEGQPDYDELAALGEKIEAVLDGEDDGSDEGGKYAVGRNEFNTQPSESEEEEEEGLDIGEDGTVQLGKIVTCPWCGSKTLVTDKFCCEHCGGNL